MPAIFYHNDEQKKKAVDSKSNLADSMKNGKSADKVYTKILPVTTFSRAEDYHQKYYLQQRRDLNKELREIYPKMREYVDSTSVARINGYVCGHGSYLKFQEDIDKLGLSKNYQRKLDAIVKALDPAGAKRAACPVNKGI